MDTEHLGNPKSLRGFAQKMYWHGLGMRRATAGRGLNRPTLLTLLNGLALLGAVVVLCVWSVASSTRVWAAVLLVLAVPLSTYAYRTWQVRRFTNPLVSLLLIEVFYLARGVAVLQSILTGRGQAAAR